MKYIRTVHNKEIRNGIIKILQILFIIRKYFLM